MDSQFAYFLMTVFVINIAPGPAMMFVLQQSQRNGLRAGLSAALGIECGVFTYVVLTALGITALFKSYPNVYSAIQIAGIIYLIYLAFLAYPRNSNVDKGEMKDPVRKKIFLKGFLINITNPKIALFFISLIPQFVPVGSDVKLFIIYGLIFNVGGIIVNFSVAFLSHRAARLLSAFKWFDYVPPLLFIAIAVISIVARLK